MPPTSLTKEQIDKLHELWEAGLTSVGDKRKIHAAVEATGLYGKTIKVINIRPYQSVPHHRPRTQSIFCWKTANFYIVITKFCCINKS